MAKITLNNLDATKKFAQILAELLPQYKLPSLFLSGQMGCGKTALTSAIVNNFENSELAEISSPSFTIYNLYPTAPEVMHCDLYRCQAAMPEEICEALENPRLLVIIEWSEYFPEHLMPEEYLDISFNLVNDSRTLTIKSKGETASRLVDKLNEIWTGNEIQEHNYIDG